MYQQTSSNMCWLRCHFCIFLYKYCVEVESVGGVFQLKNFVYDRIYEVVRNGHRKLAGELMDEKAKTGQTSFNFLHRDVSVLLILLTAMHNFPAMSCLQTTSVAFVVPGIFKRVIFCKIIYLYFIT